MVYSVCIYIIFWKRCAMSWEFCLYASVFSLFLTVVVCLYLGFSKYKKGRKLNMLHVMLAGCFVSAFLLILAPLSRTLDMDAVGIWGVFVPAVQKTIKLFGADGIYEVVFDCLDIIPSQIKSAYVFMILTVQLAAPLLSVSFLLSLFKNISAYARYYFSFWKDTFVFSNLNERSLILAEDVKKSFSGSRIVFADAYSPQKNVTELLESAKALDAILFKKDVTSIGFGAMRKKSKLCFFAMDDRDMANVENGTVLIKKFGHRPETDLYVFSSCIEGELILAGEEKGKMKVRRVNEKRLVVSRILVSEGTSIFDSARPVSDTEKQISAVIVGMGTYGTDLIKSLAWYCQMDGYRLKINGFDRDPLAEQKLCALCPELMSEEYNGVYIPGEASYYIKIHSGCDADTKSFADKLAEIGDATFVAVSLGSDEKNIEVAAKLRMLFARQGISPIIYAICEDSVAKMRFENAKNFSGQSYDIKCVGDLRSVLTARVIMRSGIEKKGYDIHVGYCNGDEEKINDFWRYEYCYHSSVASAIHQKARIHCGIPGADKDEKNRTEEEKNTNAIIEHKRWNAYMRAEGYIYSGSKERSSRNDMAKMHDALVEYKQLSEKYRDIDVRITSVK